MKDKILRLVLSLLGIGIMSCFTESRTIMFGAGLMLSYFVFEPVIYKLLKMWNDQK